MCKFKYLSCLGFMAMAVMTLMPSGVLAYDDGQQFAAPYSPFVDIVLSVNAIDSDVVAMVSITNALRSYLKLSPSDHGASCTPAIAANPSALIDGGTLAYSRPRAFI